MLKIISYPYVTIDILHPLVHSLTKSEKRYCRLLAGRQAGDEPGAARGFMRLLDCLLYHETPGDALTANLTRQFPGATLDPARKYLYRILMQSLRQFEDDKRIDVRLGQLLHDSQILYERGLAQFSGEQLAKAQRLAGQHERGLYAAMIARQQVEQWVRGQFDGVDEPTLARQHTLIQEAVDRTQTALQHAALYETLLLRYRTHGTTDNPADVLRLNDLLLEEYQLLNRHRHKPGVARSFAMQQQHLHFQSAYFRMVGDGAGSLRVYRELDELFQRNPTLWAEQPLYYVQLLDGILADLRLVGHYEEIPYFIDRLRAIDTPAQGLRRMVPYLALYHSLLIAADQEHCAEAVVRLTTDTVSVDTLALERGLSTLALPFRTEFDLLRVRIDMGTGKLTDALTRLNRVLNRPARSLPNTLYRQSRLLNLLLHARLGNADYLIYALRSVERKLRAAGPLLAAEQLTLTLLKQWLGGRLRVGNLTDVEAVEDRPANGQLVRDLDLRAWVRAMSG